MNWKACKKEAVVANFRVASDICTEKLRRTTTSLNQDSGLCESRNPNMGLKRTVTTATPGCSVQNQDTKRIRGRIMWSVVAYLKMSNVLCVVMYSSKKAQRFGETSSSSVLTSKPSKKFFDPEDWRPYVLPKRQALCELQDTETQTMCTTHRVLRLRGLMKCLRLQMHLA